jgi:hypothetical protein
LVSQWFNDSVSDTGGYSLATWICTNINVIHGYITIGPQQRLIDTLNGIHIKEKSSKENFLSVSNAVVTVSENEEKNIESLLVNKSNILFVGPEGPEKLGARQGEHGEKVYPAITKLPVKAIIHVETKLYVHDYRVTGFMHCAVNQQPLELLNSDLLFLPFTQVRISPFLFPEQQEYKAGFVAINKQHIVYIEQS